MVYWNEKDREWNQLNHAPILGDDLIKDKKGKIVSTTLSKELENVSARFESYCRELPVFGFNSAGYDIKLIKNYLFKELCKRDESPSFTVKKAGKYPCIKSESPKFLDILQFLAPGYNLKSFFKAVDANEEKGFFPYDYFTSAEQLDETTLPPCDTFYSTIKGCDVLEEDYATFENLINQGKPEQKVLQILRLQEVPKTGPENYQWLKDLCNENQWTTFADFFFKWYNDLDVNPMIQAIEKMNDYYKDKNVDFMHQAITLPGIAKRIYLNSITDPNVEIHLFNQKQQDIYQLFKDNIVGGPSIIYHRYQQAQKSFIGNNPNKLCKSILGYDANALYLHALSMDLPTQILLIRREENKFKKEFPGISEGCRDWIDWIIHDRNIKIQSALHGGGETKIGSYKDDGFCQELNIVFEFYGDYWHAHPDLFPDENAQHPTRKHDDKDNTPVTVKEIRDYDLQRLQYIQDRGYNVEIIWESKWNTLVESLPEIKTYISQHRTFNHFKKTLTQDQIIQYIKDGHLFGFIECDIHTPGHLKEYFSEFKNTEVSLKEVGQHMQKYAKQHNIKDVPKRLLISSYFGKKIGLAMPLLKWYLENDLVITRIYTVVDYVPNAALKDFIVQVAEAQLPGDRDPRYALTVEMRKLEGNASYGTLITNKEKHHDIIYVDESEIGRQIISPHFYDMTELPDGYNEVERTKPSINLNIPIHAGVFILNYAKLRMLQFYYDCVDKYLSREDLIYCEMDTDSAYMAISGDSFESLINPKLR